MSDDARTGALVTALAEGVGQDLADIAADLDRVRVRIETLGESARAINGLAVDCNGWADRLATMASEVCKERDAIPAKLLGKTRVEITTHVNPELADKAGKSRSAA